jgi:hypothetical protein
MNTHHNMFRHFLRGVLGVALLSSLASGALATQAEIVTVTEETKILKPAIGKSGFLEKTEIALAAIGYDPNFNPVKEQIDTQALYLDRYKMNYDHYTWILKVVFEELVGGSALCTLEKERKISNFGLTMLALTSVKPLDSNKHVKLEGEEKTATLAQKEALQIQNLVDFIRMQLSVLAGCIKIDFDNVKTRDTSTVAMTDQGLKEIEKIKLKATQIKNQAHITLYFLMVQNAWHEHFLNRINVLIYMGQSYQKIQETSNFDPAKIYNTLKERELYENMYNITQEALEKTLQLMQTELDDLNKFLLESLAILNYPGSGTYTIFQKLKHCVTDHTRVAGNRDVLMPLIGTNHVQMAYKTFTDKLKDGDTFKDVIGFDFNTLHMSIFGKNYPISQ